jgi:hypothetical protein
MKQAMEPVNPLEYPGWDELLLGSRTYSFFHSSLWARALHESYGYRPVFFADVKGSGMDALFPFMEVDSPITGRRGVSLPFTDYCEPIVPECGDVLGMVAEINSFGKGAGWKYAEYRCGNALPGGLPPSSTYLGHELDISGDEGSILSGFKDSTRRNIRKAEKEGVKVVISDSLDAVKSFYSLNCKTRRMHGLPPQPLRFFEAVHKHVMGRGHGAVALAHYKGQAVAANVYFSFGDKVMYKYGASDKAYQHLRANNLVMWEAIRHFAAKGFLSLCLGRTEQENEGLLQFKRGWGTKERPINYYKYDLRQGSYITETSKLRGFHNRVFANMPIPLLRLAGTLLYRHMG